MTKKSHSLFVKSIFLGDVNTIDASILFVKLVPATEFMLLETSYIDFVFLEESGEDIVRQHGILEFRITELRGDRAESCDVPCHDFQRLDWCLRLHKLREWLPSKGRGNGRTGGHGSKSS